jgi:hypothetical protein
MFFTGWNDCDVRNVVEARAAARVAPIGEPAEFAVHRDGGASRSLRRFV